MSRLRLRPYLLIVLALAAWEITARSGLWSPLLFPSLERIGAQLWAFVSAPEGATQTWTTLYRAVGGFALAALAVSLVLLPWIYYALAFQRGNESLNGLAPLGVLVALAIAANAGGVLSIRRRYA